MKIFSEINYYTFSLLLGGTISLFSGGMVYLKARRERQNFAWLLLNICTSIWSFGYYLMVISVNSKIALWNNWVLHFGAISIPLFYFLFVIHITEMYQKYKNIFYIGNIFLVIFLLLNTSSLFIKGVIPKYHFNYAPDAGPLYAYFTIYFFSFVLLAIFILLSKISKTQGEESLRLKYILWSSLVGFTGGGSVFFLTFNVNIPPYPLILFSVYPLFITYAILKYHLFDIKVIIAEFLTFAIWIAVLTQAIMADTLNGKLLGFGTLLFAIVLGIFLIKSVKKEVAQREQIEELAGRLKSVNRIMSHDIKNVLGKNKDMYGMLLDGSFGVIPEVAKPFLERLLCDTKQLVRSVISILESGQEFTLRLAPFDIKIPILEIINDVKHDAEEKGLTIKTNIDESQDYTILGDEAQLSTRVFRNLIENAVNYTLAGNVTVGLSKKADSVIFSVTDTGVGINEDDQKNLFQEGGHGKDSLKVNVHSTGYGLFSAKKVVDAHKGRIWFTTNEKLKTKNEKEEDQNGGTTFFVEMKGAKSE